MQLRKVQEMGGTTLLVSIPKDWAKAASVKKGSVLSIETSGDGGLLIYPVKSDAQEDPEKEIEISYPSRFSNEGLPNEITAAYLLGYDLIRVKGKHRIASRDRERVISSIKKLIGLEVVEEDAQSITSQFLVDKTAVEPSKILKRISTIVRAMISDTLKQVAPGDVPQFESVAQRDDEVDRLHFLLVRLIRSAVREPRSASKFGLTSIDCLDYRVAASQLETAGDYAVELSNAIANLSKVDQGTGRLFASITQLLEEISDNAARSFIAKDFTLGQRVFDQYQRLDALISDFSRNDVKVSPDLLHVLDLVERITRCQRDVADLVSPMNPA
ncbi:MAG TPA: phosphate uptake regulator PhoU [Nitrososphaerales archaeon]|nr:phosphate uptake regulator PhoU [Nitrososphaerales archaeon]